MSDKADKIDKSNEEWKKELTPEQFNVLREKGTEAPFTGKYYKNKETGMYYCAACGAPLFSSDTKFDSGTGWPSFTAPVAADAIKTATDSSHGMERTEALCPRCGSHLGHVFDDGPTKMPGGVPASGKRFCINSCALDFEAEKRE